jgi:hypothetical protein
MERHRAGKVYGADDDNAIFHDLLAWLGEAQLPPCSAARSIITDPGRIPRTISSVMSTGARWPGISAVGITASAAVTYRIRS